MRIITLVAMLLTASGPSPAIAQQPAAEPFRIFFDWGKPDISRDAAAILDELLAEQARNPGITLAIEGHSDRSGSTAANRRAAWKRADSVRAYLAERGVAPSRMTMASHGEERPIVPTEDGVREAQNRRVEIRLVPTSGE